MGESRRAVRSVSLTGRAGTRRAAATAAGNREKGLGSSARSVSSVTQQPQRCAESRSGGALCVPDGPSQHTGPQEERLAIVRRGMERRAVCVLRDSATMRSVSEQKSEQARGTRR